MAGFFDTLFGGGAEREAADRNRAIQAQYGNDAQGYLKTGYDTGTTNLNKAVGAYTPLADLGAKYNMGGDLWRDSLGINGPEGNARASGAFTNSPGYQAGIDAGMTGINRRRALGGMVDSGNADIDALVYAQNAQNKQYGDWQTQLNQSGQQGIGLIGTAAQGEAGGYGALSDLASKYAGNQAGVAGNVATGNVAASNLQAQGEASGAKNLLNAGMQIAGMVAAPFTGGLSLAGMGSMFGGGASTGATTGGYGTGLGSGTMGGIRYPAL